MSFEQQVRRKQASVEQAVREKQAFDERLREFLSIASSMTNQELEIALARLADSLQRTKDHPESIRIKGTILNIYYQLRVAGLKKQSTLARIKHNLKAGYISGSSEVLITALSGYPLLEPSAVAPTYESDDAFNAHIKLLAP